MGTRVRRSSRLRRNLLVEQPEGSNPAEATGDSKSPKPSPTPRPPSSPRPSPTSSPRPPATQEKGTQWERRTVDMAVQTSPPRPTEEAGTQWEHRTVDMAVQTASSSEVIEEEAVDFVALKAQFSSPSQISFLDEVSKHPLVMEMFKGLESDDDIFLTPVLDLVQATVELRGLSRKLGTWPHLVSSGKRPVEVASFRKLLSLMSDASAQTVLAFVMTYIGVVQWPSLQHADFSAKVQELMGAAGFALPPEYKEAWSDVAGGAKSFACPLCRSIQLRRNAKQHIVTLKCINFASISDSQRLSLASRIKKNQFIICDQQLTYLHQNLKRVDRLMLRIILLTLGGCIINKRFEPMSLSLISKDYL